MNYEPLDRLTGSQVLHVKKRTQARVRPGRKAAQIEAEEPPIFAEGDSWFDFPPGVDIIDHLVHGHGLDIRRFSKHGDTLDNMVFGTKAGDPQIEGLLRLASTVRPRVVLFSGGGNDVLGDELRAYLNHSASGLDILRQSVADYFIHIALRNAVDTFIKRVREASPGAHIILHGYGRPFPTGRRTTCLGIGVAGPWMKPILTALRLDAARGTPLIHQLGDMFNTMLASLAAARSDHVSYLDVRGIIGEDDWRDELHLNGSAYARVADLFAATIRRVSGGAGPEAAGIESVEESVVPYWEEARRKAPAPSKRGGAKRRKRGAARAARPKPKRRRRRHA